MFDTLLNPRVVVEVLSYSTEKYGRGTRFPHYRQISSVQEYVIVAENCPLVERYVRQGDGTRVLTVFCDLTQTFAFGSIDMQVALADIYRGVTFPESTGC